MKEIQFDLLSVILPSHREPELREALKAVPGAVFFRLHGVGTANSTILEILGLDDNAMLVAFVALRHEDAHNALAHLGERLHLFKAGNGIAFVLPVERYLGLMAIFDALDFLQTKSRSLQSKWQVFKENLLPCLQHPSCAEAVLKCETIGKIHTDQELVLGILNEDHAHEAIHQMRALGVRGGTIIPASGRGKHDDGQFLGMELVPEKEILIMVVPANKSAAVLAHLYDEGELSVPGSGIAFSLPVEAAIGLSESSEEIVEE